MSEKQAEKRTISSKGQVVVPKKIRDYLELKDGDQIEFMIRETGEVVVTPVKSEHPEILFGTLPARFVNTQDFEQVLYLAKEERLQKQKKEGKI